MTTRPLYMIAREIRADWKKVSPCAAPYLSALACLSAPSDIYGCGPAHGIVLGFLSNAGGWRGPKAKILKAELKGMLR